MTTVARARPLFDPPLVKVAIRDSFIKLAPWVQWRNPVMFVVLVGSLLITGLWLAQLGGGLNSEGRPWFVFAIAVWLWATLLFANFAESLAEGRGKAQAAAELRQPQSADQQAPDQHHEHHRVAPLHPGRKLDERVLDRHLDERRIEQRTNASNGSHCSPR